jgi:hypothetical protein
MEAVRALIARKAASSPPLLHDLAPTSASRSCRPGPGLVGVSACPRLAIPPPGEELELSGKFREQ